MSESVKSDERQSEAIEWGSYTVPSLAGVRGRIAFRGPRHHVQMIIDDGRVTLSPEQGDADAVLQSEIEGELLGLLCGEANLVTAILQARIEVSGDPMLVLKIAGSMPELGGELRMRAPRAVGV